MNKVDLEIRTKGLALGVIRFVAGLPKTKVADVLGYQLLKAATSVGANYREANRAESRADFIHKVNIVEKEMSESEYWLELFEETDHGVMSKRHALLKESGELLAIFIAIGKSTKFKNPKSEIGNPK